MERGGKVFGYSPGQTTLLQGSLCDSLCSLGLSSSMAHPEESKKVWFSGKKVWFSFDIDHTFLQFLILFSCYCFMQFIQCLAQMVISVTHSRPSLIVIRIALLWDIISSYLDNAISAFCLAMSAAFSAASIARSTFSRILLVRSGIRFFRFPLTRTFCLYFPSSLFHLERWCSHSHAACFQTTHLHSEVHQSDDLHPTLIACHSSIRQHMFRWQWHPRCPLPLLHLSWRWSWCLRQLSWLCSYLPRCRRNSACLTGWPKSSWTQTSAASNYSVWTVGSGLSSSCACPLHCEHKVQSHYAPLGCQIPHWHQSHLLEWGPLRCDPIVESLWRCT